MIDDKSLRDVLKTKIHQIKQYRYGRGIQRKIEKMMATKYNFKYGDTVDIFNEIPPNTVHEVSYDTLYKLMVCIHDVLQEKYEEFDTSDLYADKYFTQGEQIEFNKPMPLEDRDFDIIITDWKKVGNKFTVFTDINEVIRWRNYNKLRYNPETQRDLITIKSSKGVPVKKLDINKTSKKQMKDLMISGLYFPVRGIININPEYNEELPRIEKNNLIIPMECHMDLIEGFHNYLAETEVKDENPDWEFPCEFDIMMLTNEEANRYIIQMDKKNHFKEEQIVRMNKDDEVNYLIEKLNTSSRFHLKTSISKEIIAPLNKIIKKFFSITEREHVFKYLPIIEDNMNIIIEEKSMFRPLSKEEWFVGLYLVNESIESNIELIDLIKNIDIDDVAKHVSFNNEPTKRNFAYMTDLVEKERVVV